MVLSELSAKDVVNNEDGIKLGRIVDVEIDVASGKILNIAIDRGFRFASIFSTKNQPEYVRIIADVAPDMMYMPICKEVDEVTPMLESLDVNYIAAELVFAKDDSPLVDPAYLESHHQKGRLLWCNAILYNCLRPLSGGHTDDVAVMGDPDKGWGWIIDKGFDIIQTDWTLPLRQYMDQR